MANRVSGAFQLSFQADGTSTSITWNLKTSFVIFEGDLANSFSLWSPAPTGFVFISVSPDTNAVVTGALSGFNFTVTFGTPPPAGPTYISVYFLF